MENRMRQLLLGACACAAGLIAAVGLGIVLAPSAAISQAGSDRESSLAAWERIATVLKHPRCVYRLLAQHFWSHIFKCA